MRPGSCPLAAQLNVGPGSILYQVGSYTNPCGLEGSYCGTLVTDPIPLDGPVQLVVQLYGTIGLVAGYRTDFFTFNTGGALSGSLELAGIDLFDAQGQPIQDFSVVSQSGTVYHAPEPTGGALGAAAAVSLGAAAIRRRRERAIAHACSRSCTSTRRPRVRVGLRAPGPLPEPSRGNSLKATGGRDPDGSEGPDSP